MQEHHHPITGAIERKELAAVINAAILIADTYDQGRQKHPGDSWAHETVEWHLAKAARHALTATCEAMACQQPAHVPADPHYQDGETEADHCRNALTRMAMANYRYKKARVYISGPITLATPEQLQNFDACEAEAKKQFPLHVVVNPMKNYEGRLDLPYDVYMMLDILQVMAATYIIVLPGWELSRGSKIEISVAQALSKTMFCFQDGKIAEAP